MPPNCRLFLTNSGSGNIIKEAISCSYKNKGNTIPVLLSGFLYKTNQNFEEYFLSIFPFKLIVT